MTIKPTAPESRTTGISDIGAPTPMARVVLASLVGSAIEFYDFFLYGTAAALVFPSVFFPHLGAAMATIASLATFFSRPLGAAIFGHYGHRLGRKKTLVATLLVMGLSTVAVGLLPGAATIGVAGPLILLTLRLLQGLALGRRMGRIGPAGRRTRAGRQTGAIRHGYRQ